MSEFAPYKNRSEHDYLKTMSLLVFRCRCLIKTTNNIINEIEETTEKYLKNSIEKGGE